MDKIKYMGTYRKYINILPLDKQIIYQSKFRGDTLYNNTELTNQVIKTKINHDKILLEKFQRIIYTIKNQKNQKIDPMSSEKKVENINTEKKLINEFIPRLKNLKILDDEFLLFLQNWKNVYSSYVFIPLKSSEKLILDTDTIINNNNYNLLIRYLLTQLLKLLDMNNDKTNINLCNCIAMIFDLMWKEYNVSNNYEINKFLLLLNSSQDEDYISRLFDVEDSAPEKVIQEQEKKVNPEISEQLQEKLKDDQDDFKEEAEALDVEGQEADEMDLGEEGMSVLMHAADNDD